MRQTLGEEVSERRACKVLGQPRRTQRYVAKQDDDEPALVKRMLELVAKHPRYGYRMIRGKLKLEGWHVNRKRIWRLWKKEGLKVPQNKHKKTRLGEAVNGCVQPPILTHSAYIDFEPMDITCSMRHGLPAAGAGPY